MHGESGGYEIPSRGVLVGRGKRVVEVTSIAPTSSFPTRIPYSLDLPGSGSPSDATDEQAS